MIIQIYFLVLALIALTLLISIIVLSRKGYYQDEHIEDISLCINELEHHAEKLAKVHKTSDQKSGYTKRAQKRLLHQFDIIQKTYGKLNDDATGAFPIPPAAEWLLDNFYIIEEQKTVIYKELDEITDKLPILESDSDEKLPRIYSLAIELIAHTDGCIDEKTIRSFISAYQKVTFLTIEELWILPLMIKLALMAKLKLICRRIYSTQIDWHKAEELLDVIKQNGQESCALVKESIESIEDLTPSLVEHLIKIMRIEGSKTLWMVDCLDGVLKQRSVSTDKLVFTEHQIEASNQVAIANIISSFRVLSSFDSTSLFEELSEVEHILKQDPSGVYPKMDFDSRNQYRDVIVKLARKYRTTEINIARLSLEKATTFINKPESLPQSHVGYYIVGKGRDEIKKELDYKGSVKKISIKNYLVIILVLTLAIITALYGYSTKGSVTDKAILAVMCVLGIIPASEIVIQIINCIISKYTAPARIPKLDFKNGIPDEHAAMVIVPTLVPNVKKTIALLDNLEVFYLANRDSNLYFSLVGDFKDKDSEQNEEDNAIVEAALQKVDELNKRYPGPVPRFYFFTRKRLFNEKQNKWMGWERKRGAIIEFNRMLRGRTDTSYTFCSQPADKLPHVKYVITLDADTQLPLGTARQLIGAMAHPLNTPVFDESGKIVVGGYGLMQPRINVSVESANSTFFTRLFAGQGGIDPYTTTISDVYQDLFDEGIFTGKGIYDVDVFQKCLDDTLPENTVLSHDLLEGSYLRTCLVTDIELIDGYPARYSSFMMRLHRWTRGDWQLLPWIFGKNSLSLLSKWKMIDNLRRSLLYPVIAVLMLFVFSFSTSRLLWLAFVLAAQFIPVIGHFVNVLLVGNYRIYVTKRSATIITGLKSIILQCVLQFAFLPYQAFLLANAIAVTLGRVLFTKKNLLEWVTAADVEASLKNNLSGNYKRMWTSPLSAVIILLLSFIFNTYLLPWAFLFAALWLIAPFLAYTISKQNRLKKADLNNDEIDELRLITRKTWCYFDEFAGESDNFLPPDNYQLDPYKGAAHRTSPTNIGLLLMAYLSGRDMGYINTIDFISRVKNTISSIEKMEKWNGHLLNWYSTIDLSVLRPKFVSTVDSGNLVGYLMVLKQGIDDWAVSPIIDKAIYYGLVDLIKLCNREIDSEDKYIEIPVFNISDANELTSEELEALINIIQDTFDKLNTDPSLKQGYWVKKLIHYLETCLRDYRQYGQQLIKNPSNIPGLSDTITDLEKRIQKLIDQMDFKPLFDERKQLFSIGFDVDQGHPSKSFYDLFASEARQTSFIAVARGEVNKNHWFKLGRKLINVDGTKGLASWTGTMFEYLMPGLIIKSYPNTLIYKTYEFVLKAQIDYMKGKDRPWGISESGFADFDIGLNYQYKAFGVPKLGLKRGLINDCVIAPYASLMAVSLAPRECYLNLEKLKRIGAEGEFGFYEAVDYTDERLTQDQNFAIVKSYMVHHQGMGLLALVNFFKDDIMQKRFHRCPQVKSADILLQEKFPNTIVPLTRKLQKHPVRYKKSASLDTLLREYQHSGMYPNIHLISNGGYSFMITDKGCGYGKYCGLSVYRWSNDYTQNSGMFVFVRNLNSNEYWSTTYSPANTRPESYKTVFLPHKAEFIRREGNIETNTEITVSTEDNTEIRRISIHNHSKSPRIIELTSYAEIVLMSPEADSDHPAFSKLFVKTEYVTEHEGLLAARRKRDDIRKITWGYHTVAVEGSQQGPVEYETDRFKFIGRNRSIASPEAMNTDQPLTNTAGSVLDPVFCLRVRVMVPPEDNAIVCFSIGISDSKKDALEMLEKYKDISAASRAFEMAWTRSRVEAGFINISMEDEHNYLKLAPQLLFNIFKEGQAEYIRSNRLSQQDLWSMGISGDLPIFIVTIEDRDSLTDVQWALKAHEYYRFKGIELDLVILITDEDSYTRPLLGMIKDSALSGHAREHLDKRGGVFIRNYGQLSQEQINLLLACAKVVIHAEKGHKNIIKELDERISNINKEPQQRYLFESGTQLSNDGEYGLTEKLVSGLEFYNGLGGFNSDGSEYVIILKAGKSTPAPWCNIIANQNFGFICSEAGGGYTWNQNSRENKLTAWINDPVTDYPSETIYVHHRDLKQIWCCTPYPARDNNDYIISHGFGYSKYQHSRNGVEQELIQFAAENDPAKLCIVKFKNNNDKNTELDVAYYLRPVLGTDPGRTAQHIVTDFNEGLKSIIITNNFSSDFKNMPAFVSCSEDNLSYTGQRNSFMGPQLSVNEPTGMAEELDNTVGAGFDTCVALKTTITILPGQTREVVFILGQAADMEQASILINKYRNIDNTRDELERVRQSWNSRLKMIQVDTPDKSMNILLNGWLQYQVLSSRIWARTGFYQAGGAFGFRDQLQDVMAMAYSQPEITKNQILLHCRHQFIEGDVQHWWHDQKSNGIRTRYSDDLLWLPYVTCDYISKTGDYGILNNIEKYIESPVLEPTEHERYEVPTVSEKDGSVYEHCIKAIECGLKFGSHGIPLMGGGDWNDGMNLVGAQGRGESIWLGWFMYCMLQKMIPICDHMGDTEHSIRFKEASEQIIEAIENEAWDGSWYRRAYFDDGTPLGSIQNSEAKIDSLAQSWAAISGTAKPSRVEEAMDALEKYLVDRKNGLIKLLTPPFNDGELNPGYIKGYLPGVRENGGQYTHAATWVIQAFAKLQDGDSAWDMYNMINPINHARTYLEYMTYKVEPYIMAADVYAVYPNEGRGGWTWYTGAAGWMYRIGLENLIGITKEDNTLVINPCIPKSMNRYSIKYRYGSTIYTITVDNRNHVNSGVKSVSIDRLAASGAIVLTDDGKTHVVEVIMG